APLTAQPVPARHRTHRRVARAPARGLHGRVAERDPRTTLPDRAHDHLFAIRLRAGGYRAEWRLRAHAEAKERGRVVEGNRGHARRLAAAPQAVPAALGALSIAASHRGHRCAPALAAGAQAHHACAFGGPVTAVTTRAAG